MNKRQSKKKKAARRILAVSLFALLLWTIWGNTALMVNTITIADSRIPAAFSGFRIAQISDLHNAEFGKDNAKLFKRLSECEPDIIAVTGDLVDMNHTDLNVAITFAQKAIRIAPVYYVTGNHEAHLPQYDALRDGLEAAGVILLDDKALQLEHGGAKITIAGLSDPDFRTRYDMFEETSATGAAFKKQIHADQGYTILLSHRPELFESYVSCGADLVFSGHAHGGQFRLPFVGGLIAPNQGLFPKYDAGLYIDGDTQMVVSRGIGNSIIPVRFHNRPEIVLAVLQAGRQK